MSVHLFRHRLCVHWRRIWDGHDYRLTMVVRVGAGEWRSHWGDGMPSRPTPDAFTTIVKGAIFGIVAFVCILNAITH